MADGSDGKQSAYKAGDPGLIHGSGRSPGEGNGNPFQYSCLGNPMDREEHGRLQSMRLQVIRQDLAAKQQQQEMEMVVCSFFHRTAA